MPFPRNKSRSSSRVVITGAGVVTALGCGWKINAEGFRAGRGQFRTVSLFDVSRQRVKTAAEVELPPVFPSRHLASKQLERIDRAGKLLLLAADEAWKSAGWESVPFLPMVLGTTSGGMSLGETYYRDALDQPDRHRNQPSQVMNYQAQQQGIDLASAFDFEGPLSIIANACASGANALGHAWDLVRTGQAEAVFAGGYDALSQMVFAGFDSLQALSPTSCRPFAQDRDGLALGEGAAMFTLESLDRAKKRGAPILAELVGYGAATDPHHLTQPQPDGNAALASMMEACQRASLSPGRIQYVNAHGTGTPLNDSAEAMALNRWSGNNPELRVSSTKSGIGHLLGAAGAVESAICLMALQGGWLPPTIGVDQIDPVCRFELVRKPRDEKVEYALSNSFGFGGANASLIFRRWG